MSDPYRTRLEQWLRQSTWHWQALLAANRTIPCPWWIGAGFLRNLIWDHVHDFPVSMAADIDVLVMDRDVDTAALETALANAFPADWSVKNQPVMHEKRGIAPCTNIATALKFWLEKPTAIAVNLQEGTPGFLTPFGLAPAFSLAVEPTPYGKSRPDLYLRHVTAKNWPATWPNLTITLP